MDWTQTMTIIGSIIGLGGLILWVFNKLDNDINRLSNRLDGHASRIDQLYQMFVDLLKEKK